MPLNPLIARYLQNTANATPQPTDSWQKAMTPTAAPAAPGGSPWAGTVGSNGGGSGATNIDRILATIRQRESGGNYSIKNGSSNASGAYQFMPKTWRGLGGQGWAGNASPQEQDRIARKHVTQILAQYGGQLEAVPAAWYTGSYKGKGNLNYNPGGPGNPLSVQQYVDKWISDYNRR